MREEASVSVDAGRCCQDKARKGIHLLEREEKALNKWYLFTVTGETAIPLLRVNRKRERGRKKVSAAVVKGGIQVIRVISNNTGTARRRSKQLEM